MRICGIRRPGRRSITSSGERLILVLAKEARILRFREIRFESRQFVDESTFIPFADLIDLLRRQAIGALK
jgi:hypothetical protein